jgi:hypothetical protein
MATYITLAQQAGSQLLEANRRQTIANRQGLAKQEKARQTATQQQEQAPPKPVSGSRRVVLPGDELAAFRFGKVRRFAHAFFTYEVSGLSGFPSYPVFPWTVYCGDLSSQLDEEDAWPDEPGAIESPVRSANIAQLLLPAGGDVAILALSIRLSSTYRINYNPSGPNFATVATVLNPCYVLSTSVVRGIETPSGLQAAFDLLNPANPDAIYDAQYDINGVETNPYPPRQIDAGFTGAFDGYSYWRTPAIYALLNQIAPFIDDGLVKQFPAGLRPVTQDWRYGYWAEDPADKSFYYAEWLGIREEYDTGDRIDLLKALPKSTLRLPSLFAFPTPANSNSFVVGWDWDDPAYCRQMLIALGFSSADLVP